MIAAFGVTYSIVISDFCNPLILLVVTMALLNLGFYFHLISFPFFSIIIVGQFQ